MESWYITIQGIYTPTLQRVEFSRFPAPQCIGESNFHWAVPCKLYCDWNSSSECWRRWVGACLLHHCQGRRWEHPIRRGRNAHKLEQYNTGRTSSSSKVQVFTLDRNGHQIRELAVESNSAIAYPLSGSINSKHTNSNADCNPTRACVRCHSIWKWSSGKQ